MRVLGIDPGTVTTGWGVVEERGTRLVRVAGGVVRVRGVLAARLAAILKQIDEVLTRFSPAALCLEKSFVAANVQSAFRLGEARGVVLAAGARAGIPIGEYSPAEIKVAVVGTGRATKEQVQNMVCRLLALDGEVTPDQADALAAAICYLHARRLSEHVGDDKLVQLVRARRRGRGRRWLSLAGRPGRPGRR
ncbi:MAG: crossover junction endodeoxyribonuclease RuvC [Deltaproteobacteria bacterium]|nr:crossover junction endodeoxyribonuclease RuvC [Deltaproteobacteria bacterium]